MKRPKIEDYQRKLESGSIRTEINIYSQFQDKYIDHLIQGQTYPLASASLDEQSEATVCDCDKDHVCGNCHVQKGWIVKDGKLVKQTGN